MDPVCKRTLAVDVGDRTQAMAQRLVHHVTQVLAPDGAPLFLTDGFGEYLKALVTRWMPLPGLLYAQVVKSYRRRRIVGITHRVIFGAAETLESTFKRDCTFDLHHPLGYLGANGGRYGKSRDSGRGVPPHAGG